MPIKWAGASSDSVRLLSAARKGSTAKIVACDEDRRCELYRIAPEGKTRRLFLRMFMDDLVPDMWGARARQFSSDILDNRSVGAVYLIDPEKNVYQIYRDASSKAVGWFQYVSDLDQVVLRENAVHDLAKTMAEKYRWFYKKMQRPWDDPVSWKIVKEAPDFSCPDRIFLMEELGLDQFCTPQMQLDGSVPNHVCLAFEVWKDVADEDVLDCVDSTQVFFNLGRMYFNRSSSFEVNAYYDYSDSTITAGKNITEALIGNDSKFEKVLRHECLHREFEKRYVRREGAKMMEDAYGMMADELEAEGYFREDAKRFFNWYVNYGMGDQRYEEEILAYGYSLGDGEKDAEFYTGKIDEFFYEIYRMYPHAAAVFILQQIAGRLDARDDMNDFSREIVLYYLNDRLDQLTSLF
jgi:hypothetical protein